MSGEASDERTRALCRDNGDGMHTKGTLMQHGRPCGVTQSEGQPVAREGQTGRDKAAEGLIVPGKPGNAGGGKGPQFKGNARSSEVQEIGRPINSK